MVEKYKCPKCGIKKPFEMFGRRLMNGSTLARQSYCTKCRGLKSTRRKAVDKPPKVRDLNAERQTMSETFGRSPSIDDMPKLATVSETHSFKIGDEICIEDVLEPSIERYRTATAKGFKHFIAELYDETYPNDSYKKQRSYKTKLQRLKRKGVL